MRHKQSLFGTLKKVNKAASGGGRVSEGGKGAK